MKFVIIVATVASYALSAAAWTIPVVNQADVRSRFARVKEEEAKKPFDGKDKNVASSRNSLLLLRAGATFPIDPGILQSSLKYYVEATGTFILLSSILTALKDKGALAPVYIGIVVTAIIIWGGKIAGGHFNPAVSVMFWMNKTISFPVMVGYIMSQLLGAFLASILVI